MRCSTLEHRPLGLPGKGFQGDAYFGAANPPFGATFTYYLKDKIKTLKEQRQSAEKDAVKKDGKEEKGPYASVPYPSSDVLRAEAEEQKPEIGFVVYDESGAAIRRVAGDTAEGFHRATWDLRYATQALPAPSPEGEGDEDFPSAETSGPLVFPASIRCECSRK